VPNFKPLISFAIGVVLFFAPANAQEVRITADIPFVEIDLGDQFLVIERNPDTNAVVDPDFARTSRPCPPFCIHPMTVAEGVETLGELEVIKFIQDYVQSGEGFLVDSRTPRFFKAGNIPGSINLPFNLLTASADNPFLEPLLTQLGGTKQSGGDWNFTNAKRLALYCNGPWCDQTPRAIKNLLAAGYPADKLYYYRGGMQNWLMMGLTVVVPAS